MISFFVYETSFEAGESPHVSFHLGIFLGTCVASFLLCLKDPGLKLLAKFTKENLQLH